MTRKAWPDLAGRIEGNTHVLPIRVYFEDTDAYAVVYYANYLKFMERARSDMIRAAGVDQFAELKRSGSAYVVADLSIKYKQPAKLGDELIVISTVDEVRAASVVIQQRVIRSGELLTDARVTAAFLDAKGRPQRQPKEWVEKFKQIAGSHN